MEHDSLKKLFYPNLIYRFAIFCLSILVLEEQVAVGLYCILTGSCSSQTKPRLQLIVILQVLI